MNCEAIIINSITTITTDVPKILFGSGVEHQFALIEIKRAPPIEYILLTLMQAYAQSKDLLLHEMKYFKRYPNDDEIANWHKKQTPQKAQTILAQMITF